MRRLTLALSGLAALLVISGCGIRGDLERPPPVWGPDERTDEERAHETEDGDSDAAGEPR
jgi:Predicted small periplasmic lipoprotein